MTDVAPRVTRHTAVVDLCGAGDVARAAAVAHETWDSLRALIDTLPDGSASVEAPTTDVREKA